MKTYQVNNFKLNGDPIEIKFEPHNETFYMPVIYDKNAGTSRRIPLLVERKDVYNALILFRRMKKDIVGSPDTFRAIIAGAISTCMKYKNF